MRLDEMGLDEML